MGAISGALPQLQDSFDLDKSQLGWLVSILFIGGGFGASIGGPVCDRFGRKVTIMLTDVVFMVGACWLYVAGGYQSVLMGRFIVGVGVAVSGVADVSYLHECAPLEWRGSIVSVNEACISLGFLLAYVAGYVYTDAEKEEWRIIFGWAGVLAAVQLLGMIRLPESPAWLTEKGRIEDARLAWQQINSGSIGRRRSSGGSDIDVEHSTDSIHPVLAEHRIEDEHLDADRTEESDGVIVMGIANELDNPKATTGTSSMEECYQHSKNDLYDGDSIRSLPFQHSRCCSRMTSWFRAIGSKLQSARYILSRQTYIALFLAVIQQFCGQTIVLNYAPMIFAEAAKRDVEAGNVEDGNDGKAPDWSTVAVGLVKFLVTVLVIWRIEYVDDEYYCWQEYH
jgi:MFS family permease